MVLLILNKKKKRLLQIDGIDYLVYRSFAIEKEETTSKNEIYIYMLKILQIL